MYEKINKWEVKQICISDSIDRIIRQSYTFAFLISSFPLYSTNPSPKYDIKWFNLYKNKIVFSIAKKSTILLMLAKTFV